MIIIIILFIFMILALGLYVDEEQARRFACRIGLHKRNILPSSIEWLQFSAAFYFLYSCQCGKIGEGYTKNYKEAGLSRERAIDMIGGHLNRRRRGGE